MPKGYTCPNCGSRHFQFVGMQWWPTEVLKRVNSNNVVYDTTNHPNEGGLRMYICSGCKTSKLDIPQE